MFTFEQCPLQVLGHGSGYASNGCEVGGETEGVRLQWVYGCSNVRCPKCNGEMPLSQ